MNLDDKIEQAQDTAAIREIRRACIAVIYRGGVGSKEQIRKRALALLSEVIGAFPRGVIGEIPELEELYQKLENGEVEL